MVALGERNALGLSPRTQPVDLVGAEDPFERNAGVATWINGRVNSSRTPGRP
jgi:hypothetical protein